MGVYLLRTSALSRRYDLVVGASTTEIDVRGASGH